MQCLSKYPPVVDRDQAGNIYTLGAPIWVNTDTLLDSQRQHLADSLSKDKNRFDLYVETHPEVQGILSRQQKPRAKVLKHMAQQLFYSLYLGSTYASITIPFDVRPCVGRTYTVKDTENNGIFIGFLRDVTHDVTLSADGGAAAVTNLIFTHVRVVGANLKQLNLEDINAATTRLLPKYVDGTYKTADSVMA